MSTIGFEDFYDLTTTGREWLVNKLAPTHLINCNGYASVKSGRAPVTRYTRLFQGSQKYDDLVCIAEFKDYEQWVSITEDHEVHRKGSIRHKISGEFYKVFSVLASKKVSVYLLIESAYFVENPERRWCHDKYTQLKLSFPHLTFEKIFTICPTSRDFLMCIRHPHLLLDWNGIAEVGDIAGQSTKVWDWSCHIHNEPTTASVNDKSQGKKLCAKCKITTFQRGEISRQGMVDGNNAEIAIVEMFGDHPALANVKQTSVSGSSIDDVSFKLKASGDEYGTQVKLLGISHTNSCYNETYKMDLGNYPDDMLMIGIDATRSRFFVAPRKELPANQAAIIVAFTHRSTEYNTFKYTDKNLFIEAVINLLPKSSKLGSLEDRYSSTGLKEALMRDRLYKKLTLLGIPHRNSKSNFEVYDMFIREKKVQLKFTTHTPHFRYTIPTRCRNGGGTFRPYNITDGIDFFICEIGGYEDRFLILPQNALIDKGVLGTEDQLGVKVMTIPPPDYSNISDPLMRYWDAFSLL